MKKKILMTAVLALALASCGNATEAEPTSEDNQTSVETEEKASEVAENEAMADSEKPEENIEEDTNDEANDDAKEESDPSDEMIIEERDGRYFSTLMASKNGERSEDFNAGFVSNLTIEDDVLTVDGTIDYLVDLENTEDDEKYDKGSFHFNLSPDVKLQSAGGDQEPTVYTKEEFLKFYEEVKDSGLALFIDVKDGLVTLVSISS
ncbi:hypothetical protein [Anaerococcus provencensis]|uniref:hypothetical protein n=1 Tax=Anaerococcus provencensis TaxID=938293 RepID=UPI0002D4A28D|nr:hypothetical protein [Anaerococcus provencensis]